MATLEQLVCAPSDISLAAACRGAISKHDAEVTSGWLDPVQALTSSAKPQHAACQGLSPVDGPCS